VKKDPVVGGFCGAWVKSTYSPGHLTRVTDVIWCLPYLRTSWDPNIISKNRNTKAGPLHSFLLDYNL
jgi:hypothetical protein